MAAPPTGHRWAAEGVHGAIRHQQRTGQSIWYGIAASLLLIAVSLPRRSCACPKSHFYDLYNSGCKPYNARAGPETLPAGSRTCVLQLAQVE